MATSSVNSLLHVPGYLVKNPVDLTTAFPHGGTALGMVKAKKFRPQAKYSMVTAEEWGGIAVDGLLEGESAIFAAVLREFDDDALTAIFPNTKAGSSTGHRVIQSIPLGSSAVRAGTKMSGFLMELVFSPVALDYHPFLVMYRAMPMIAESAELQLAMGEEAGWAVMFRAIPHATKGLYQIGRRADLTL